MQGKGGYETNSLRIQVYSVTITYLFKKYKALLQKAIFIGLFTGMLN